MFCRHKLNSMDFQDKAGPGPEILYKYTFQILQK